MKMGHASGYQGRKYFRNEKGVYKLGDFGVAKMLHGEESASSVKGTADYMAPEILQNKKAITRALIYILWEWFSIES